jgi:hypothetical protein
LGRENSRGRWRARSLVHNPLLIRFQDFLSTPNLHDLRFLIRPFSLLVRARGRRRLGHGGRAKVESGGDGRAWDSGGYRDNAGTLWPSGGGGGQSRGDEACG